MLQAQIIRSTTFQWALAVAGVFAIFVIVLFGFIYWQTDQYLIARSDRVIARQLDVIAALPSERRLDAISEHLKQDTRGVQYAGLFGADGHKMAGNLDQLPPGLKMNGSVQGVPVVRALPAGLDTRVIRAIARRISNGDALVIGREVENQGDFPRRRSGAGAWVVAGALPMPTRWCVAEHARPETSPGGQSAGAAHYRRRSTRAASTP
jgi:hypothetical protein